MPRVIEDRIRRQAFCRNSLLDYAAIDNSLNCQRLRGKLSDWFGIRAPPSPVGQAG
jgi:hypothetical protein